MPGKGGRRGKCGKHEILISQISSFYPSANLTVLPLFDLFFFPFHPKDNECVGEHKHVTRSTLLNYRFATPSVRPSVRSNDSSRADENLIYFSNLRHITAQRLTLIDASPPFSELGRLRFSVRLLLARENPPTRNPAKPRRT